MSAFRRACGAVLTALVVMPVFRLLRDREIGIMGADVLLVADQDRALLLIGTPIALVLGFLIARVVGAARVEALAARVGHALRDAPPHRFALALGIIAALYAAAFSLLVLDGKPNLIDSMTQLLHARFIASGDLAGPATGWNEFWHVQNSLVTPRGWVSHFPPGHVMLLAAGFALGAVWAVGPMLCGIAIFFTALAADRLLPEDRAVARLGALLAAASPFFIAHAGAYMNHVSAAAFATAAIYLGLRARDEGGFIWPGLAGGATGAAFTIRPLAAVVTALVVTVIFAGPSPFRALPTRAWVRSTFAAIVGGLPFLAALGAYNARFFGSPLHFGYPAAWGPASGLGFHRDPWGNAYGIVDAIGFTSSDLTALSLHLLGTPIPVVLVAGLYLLAARKLTQGERIIALWALLPVVANLLYWHHGMFMGPRMLNEASPAWALLAAVAAVGLVRRIPSRWEVRDYSARAGIAGAFALAAVTGIVYLGPDRLRQYGGSWMESTRMDAPQLAGPALVFVHGGWTSRIAMRLAAAGMRLDSLETALRLNPTCEVHQLARRYPEGGGAAPDLDFSPRSGELRPRIETARGNYIRVREGGKLSPECQREAVSDTLGIADIAPLVWQGDLPGNAGTGALILRDMGPAANAAVIAAHPGRVPFMLLRRSNDEAPTLVPYAEGVAALWPDASAPGSN